MTSRRSIQHRLVFYVSIGLLFLALLSGLAIYRFAFDKELTDADSLERQLVATVQAQAEVAVFANNTAIADGVIEGLRANPRILAVTIVGYPDYTLNVSAGEAGPSGEATTREYLLRSPVNDKQTIGLLAVVRNDALIRADASHDAQQQTLLMVVQIMVTALLILVFSHYLIGLPVNELASRLAAIKPGQGERIRVASQHQHDEIGSLADSANALIQAAEDALAEIRALATTDPLTGLPNRRAFMERIADEHLRIKRYTLPPASVLMLDLDHFKYINDQHGHAAGDAVLRYFGLLLAGDLRQVDFAGRIGGEEFAVLLPATEISAAAVFAERLRQQTEQAIIKHEGISLSVTISIGIASLAIDDPDYDAALAAADKALYQAKHEGRNRMACHDSSCPEPGPERSVAPSTE